MTDLTPYLHRADILTETALQIIKDFASQGIVISFQENSLIAYDTLFVQVLSCMEELQNKNNAKFYSLMYRIDISEETIKNTFAKAQDKTFAATVTELILKRELLKVVFRKQFSGK